jgi:hypothetical protein
MGERRDTFRVSGGNLTEDLGVVEMIILKWIFKELNRGIDGMDLTQDRDRFRDVLITGISFRIE